MVAVERATIEAIESRLELKDLIAEAASVVPPLWPLGSAIAVNPLTGFEQLPFEQGVREGARLFDARAALPMRQWRALLDRGDVSQSALKQVAIARLGGPDLAFAAGSRDRSRFDLLMQRLLGEDGGAADSSFADAVGSLSPARRAGPELFGYAKAFVAKWCGAFFDQAIAGMSMPHRRAGFYRAVLRFAAHDPDFWRFGGDDSAGVIASADPDAETAIGQSLTALGIEGANRLAFMKELTARLPGWTGHIRWRESHGDPNLHIQAPGGIADLIAVWLLVERACALRLPTEGAEQPAALAAADRDEIAALSDIELGLIWMEAAELTFQTQLMPRLEQSAKALPQARETRPAAQLVFCIDVRSEPFRRAIEAQGDYETFGYAGFFGLPIAVEAPHDHKRAQLPVLLSPAHRIPLTDTSSSGRASMRGFAAATRELASTLKSGAPTQFAAAEAMGPMAALIAAARTLAPRLVPSGRDCNHLAPARDDSGLVEGLPVAAQIDAARTLFAATGMPRRTARLVVLAGHRGDAANNPYAAALDCGACGGHAGGVNARIMAAILNEPAVRAALAQDSEAVPDDTVFIAAEHNTTTDEVTLLDLGSVPETHRIEATALAADLAAAGGVNRDRRARALDRGPEEAWTAARHWGEVRPEWGLARNAAFIVGPRALTRSVDLEGRAFLHSYDWHTDADGAVLALILTAPMVVAQWIGCQYLFSTLDNERFGAGDKTTHNVMGGIGVVQGNGGDLRVGLPRQSLFRDDGSPYHVPQRLLTVVHAPLDRVEQVIYGHEVLQRLFGNGWVRLIVIDPKTGKVCRWREDAELGAPPVAPAEPVREDVRAPVAEPVA
jgi:hypothetical protein